LEFDESKYEFSYVIEYNSREGKESSRRVPLSKASGER